jgi:hypothetical protein
VSGPTRGMAGHRNVFGHGPNVDKEKAFFSPSAAGGCDIGWRVSSSSDFFGAGLGGRRCGSKRFSHNFIRTRGLLPLFAATTTHSRSRSRSRAHAFPPAIENTLFPNPSIDFPWSPQFHSPPSDIGLAGITFMRASEQGEARKCVSRDVDKTARVSSRGRQVP